MRFIMAMNSRGKTMMDILKWWEDKARTTTTWQKLLRHSTMYLLCRKISNWKYKNFSDPFYSHIDPDHRICFVEKRARICILFRIRTEIEKIQTFFFSDYRKNDCNVIWWTYNFIMLLYNLFTEKHTKVFVIWYFFYDIWLVLDKAGSSSLKWNVYTWIRILVIRLL